VFLGQGIQTIEFVKGFGGNVFDSEWVACKLMSQLGLRRIFWLSWRGWPRACCWELAKDKDKNNGKSQLGDCIAFPPIARDQAGSGWGNRVVGLVGERAMTTAIR
jgi:hypothetical protein